MTASQIQGNPITSKESSEKIEVNTWHTSIDFIIWSGIIFYGLNELLPYDAIALRYMTLAAIIIPGILVNFKTLFIIPRVMIACVWEKVIIAMHIMIKRLMMSIFVFGLSLFVVGDLQATQQGVWARAGKYFFLKNSRKVCLRY